MKTFHKRWMAFLVTGVFTVTQLGFPSPGWSQPRPFSPQEVKVPVPFSLELPPNLGSIEELIPPRSGGAPTLIHIQDAHGNFEAQKNIQALLRHLHQKYAVDLVLMEGASTKLRPELIRFFPGRMDLTMKIAEGLTRKALVKGPELFLLEAAGARAYGIENVETYRENGEAFKSVLRQQDKTRAFLQEMDLQIERLTSPYLNKNLRIFLKRLEKFEAKEVPLNDWLAALKDRAAAELGLDLANPYFQADWPMLLRVFTLRSFEEKLDRAAFEKERARFLSVIARPLLAGRQAKGAEALTPMASGLRRPSGPPRNDDLYKRIQTLLHAPLSHHPLPNPETGLLFERMVSLLPADFDYGAYPNVNRFIGHLILQSELKPGRLMEELERLTEKITESLTKNELEKDVVRLLKDHRLLKKLFALELTPEDYKALQGLSPEGTVPALLPSQVISRFLALNSSRRVRNIEFTHVREIDSLFEKALEFYRTVEERDQAMLPKIERIFRETGAQKAVVITGGFHARPFRDYFSQKGYAYALIAPKISSVEGREAYLQATLQEAPASSTRAQTSLAELSRARRTGGANHRYEIPRVAGEIAQALSEARIQMISGPSVRAELRQNPPGSLIHFDDLFGRPIDAKVSMKGKGRVPNVSWSRAESRASRIAQFEPIKFKLPREGIVDLPNSGMGVSWGEVPLDLNHTPTANEFRRLMQLLGHDEQKYKFKSDETPRILVLTQGETGETFFPALLFYSYSHNRYRIINFLIPEDQLGLFSDYFTVSIATRRQMVNVNRSDILDFPAEVEFDPNGEEANFIVKPARSEARATELPI